MAAQYSSKHGTVGQSPMVLYMAFTDLRNFNRAIPQDASVSLSADYDRITVTAQGMSLSAKIVSRQPYSLIELENDGGPLAFSGKLHFDDGGAGKTDFWIEVSAEIPAMLKVMVGGKIKQALDKAVDSIVQGSVSV